MAEYQTDRFATWVILIRDICFPTLVTTILIYAVLVKLPENARQMSNLNTGIVLDTVLQNRSDIISNKKDIDDLKNTVAGGHARSQEMLTEIKSILSQTRDKK